MGAQPSARRGVFSDLHPRAPGDTPDSRSLRAARALVTLLRSPCSGPLPNPPLSGEGVQGPARTALRASSWQPVVVPAGELDEGLPGRSEPSFLSGRGPPSPGASISGGRVAGAAPRSAMVATGWRPLVSEDRAIMREVGKGGITSSVITKLRLAAAPTSPLRGGRNCEAISGGGIAPAPEIPLPKTASLVRF